MRALNEMLRGSLVLSMSGLAALAASTPACNGGECSTGTVRLGDTCLAVDPFDKTPPKLAVDPPRFTRQVGTVRIKSDERATIYYTIDGEAPTTASSSEPDLVLIPNVPDNTELRYFAIDLNGNQSAEELFVWVIDRDGPSAPIDFSLAFANPSRTLSWMATPDPRPGGVIVARVEGQLGAPPISGKTYAVGDVLSPGVTVVNITGPEPGIQTFSESKTSGPGLVRYVAWSFDDLHNYGPPTGDYTVVPMPPQSASITVTGAGTVVVNTQPTHLQLSGTATLTGPTLDMKLTVRNDTARVLYAPKMIVTNTITGATWSNSTGMLNALPYRAYGAAIQPGTTASAQWTFTGANANTSLDLNLDLQDGHVLAASLYDDQTAGSVVDAATGLAVLDLAAPPTGQGGGGGAWRGGFTPDGRMVVGARTAGVVSSYDLVTGTRLLTATLKEQKAQVPAIIVDRSGTAAYALVADGHWQRTNQYGSGTGSRTELVRLDAATFTETGRIDLGISKNRNIDLAADGKTLIVSTGLSKQGVIVVDLVKWAIKTRILPDFRPQVAVFVPSPIEGTSIAVVGEEIAFYNADGIAGTVRYPTPGTNGKVVAAKFTSGSVMWIGRNSELAFIDLNTGVATVIPRVAPTYLDGAMLEVFDGKAYAMASRDLVRLDSAGAIEMTMTGFSYISGHWVGRSPF